MSYTYDVLEPHRRSRDRRYKVHIVNHYLRNNTQSRRTSCEGEEWLYENLPEEFAYLNQHNDCVGTRRTLYTADTRVDHIIVTDLLKWNSLTDSPRVI